MKETNKLKLQMPEDNDTADIAVLNGNFEALDTALSNKADWNGGIVNTDIFAWALSQTIPTTAVATPSAQNSPTGDSSSYWYLEIIISPGAGSRLLRATLVGQGTYPNTFLNSYTGGTWQGWTQLATASQLSNRNLLDNWDFRNVVNQRGQAAYTIESGYTFDRWFCMFGTVSASAAGITIQKTAGKPYVVFYQDIEKERLFSGKTYTLSCIYQGRVLSVSGKIEEAGYGIAFSGFTGDPTDRMETYYNSDNLVYTVRFVFVTESPITIEAVKLELGSVSTLANDPPVDYGTELLKCQRYFEVIDIPINAIIPATMHTDLTNIHWRLSYKTTKRVAPTISFLDGITGRFIGLEADLYLTAHTALQTTTEGCGIVSATSAQTGLTSGWVDGIGRVAISADL